MAAPTILIADDNEEDKLLLEYGFVRQRICNPLQLVSNGKAAIDYLSGAGGYANRQLYPMPGLIITDFLMPQVSAIELLRWLRHEPELGKIPVIVLLGSANEDELAAATTAGATLALSKIPNTTLLVEQMKPAWGGWQYNPH